MVSGTSKSHRVFRLTLPATSANLGPAFDAAALALSLFLRIKAEAADDFSIAARGRDAGICGRLDNHLILTTYREVLQSQNRPVIPLSLQIENEIPIGKGCGSSAAARLAGIALANHFGRLRWPDARIMGEATCREHHPDNAAACWMGGLAVARSSAEQEVQFANVPVKGKWPLLLAVPDQSLATEEARRVLPERYSRADVVSNIQNSMLLLAAFSQGRTDLLATALADRIHQPYRSPLCPLLPALQSLTGTKGILGVVLSGAGPSVLIFLEPKAKVNETKRRVLDHLRGQNLNAELIEAAIRSEGAASSLHAAARRSHTRRP
ncbi:MAG TPA: homoserine kinase [Terriglobales bacterium]|nr:homoserine kinase [Terriglobales bacterium]